jgi:nickel-dependent lactate racemase
MLLFAKGSENTSLKTDEIKEALFSSFDKLGLRKKVLAIPPDISRFHSMSGEITGTVYNYYQDRLADVLPSIGTHSPMTEKELDRMFPSVPKYLFRVHRWKDDLITLGEVPAEFINEVSEGKLNYSWPAQTNKLLVEGKYDLILSIGQVVPHEVIGMANYNKNIFVGAGGKDSIHKSHYLGAVYGMERIMGRADTC